MKPGDLLVCTEDGWHNAFGERHTVLQAGMRLIVRERYRIAGSTFLSFEEFPEESFLSLGFEAVARLN